MRLCDSTGLNQKVSSLLRRFNLENVIIEAHKQTKNGRPTDTQSEVSTFSYEWHMNLV